MAETLSRSTLFLAITRPTMRWGVPWEGFKINLFGSMFGSMILGNPLYAVIAFLAIHFTMRAKASQDHNFFREHAVAWSTFSYGLGSAENGGATLEPIASRRSRKAREMMTSV